MRRPVLKYVVPTAAIGALAVVAALAAASSAFAYGKADQPIAQVEISANCDNPSFSVCQQVGLGGVWAWAELDTAGGSPAGGSMDYTLTFCDHTGAGSGPHGAGAFGHPGTGTWQWIEKLSEAPPEEVAFRFFDPAKYDGSDGYYVLDFGDAGFTAVVPATDGHYSSPADWPHGAQFQTQVAP
jgi:hypothetical protein